MRRLSGLLLCSSILVPSALGGVPDYDFQWATIGDPGNRAATQAEAPGFYNASGVPFFNEPGRVDYTYRMATTEVTNAQYLEFLNAYAPHYDGSFIDSRLTGAYIFYSPSADKFIIGTDMENRATRVTWRMAARYTNWLHNGKGTDAAAFETGVYDTSTFGRDPDTNQLTDQRERSSDATFWIPSVSEWTKAMYWDPNKGPDGGYWLYHNGSDWPGIYDLPQNGGTSNAGTLFHLDVASYAAMSPWGLFDGSGGEREMLENTDGSIRFIAGSLWSSGPTDSRDRIGALGVTAPELGLIGFRVAGVVPSPSSLVVLGFGSLAVARRRR
ncbi:MAG: PEP-CTERM sorting domain-containing protein [Phycisphaerales bacterium]|nr:PEP-CTERM sorting domain-containing protein [Planctomycetota bacterium]MCH8508247.1 PEP-CTERM sorting domain-containing protein [Phycisphaerales bacterium]